MEVTDHYGNYGQGRKCSGCGVPVTNACRTGKCRACYYGPERACSRCEAPIARKSRTGKCGPCYRAEWAPRESKPSRVIDSASPNYSLGRTCSGCGDLIFNKSRTGKCRSCFNKWRTGTNHHNWKGGTVNENGYRIIYGHKGHPNAYSRGEIAEHILFMSQHLGRALTKEETVHHRNGDRADNRLENLELWSTKQPFGQRAVDKVRYARKILSLYGDDVDKGVIV